jgi:hypothetical protein
MYPIPLNMDVKFPLQITGILFVLCIGLFLNSEVNASSDPGQNAFLQKREGFLLYNNTNYNFQILYPQDWTIIEGDSEPGDFVTNIVFFEPLGEKGEHHSKKFPCGEVCVLISIDNSPLQSMSLDTFSDSTYNNLKAESGSEKLLEYNSISKLGDKRAFELLYEKKQGNREYLQRFIGTGYPDPDETESKAFLILQFKTRTKYSNEMLPLANTMIDSFRFTNTKP